MSFTTGYDKHLSPQSDHWVLALLGHQLVVRKDTNGILHRYHAFSDFPCAQQRHHYLGLWRNQPCFLLVYKNDQEIGDASDYEISHLRRYLDVLPEEEFLLAGRSLQLAYWLDQHQFCGRCGQPNRLHDKERALACENCNNLVYPRISPCVIGLVKREGQCLLAHNARFPEGRYSVLAGFVEPGETAEEALAREVMEETSIAIKNLRYITSQSWPFPSQLMLGFIAEYDSGDICVDGEEITHADWFTPDAFPDLPPPGTISGKLIDLFVKELDASAV